MTMMMVNMVVMMVMVATNLSHAHVLSQASYAKVACMIATSTISIGSIIAIIIIIVIVIIMINIIILIIIDINISIIVIIVVIIIVALKRLLSDRACVPPSLPAYPTL